MSQATTTSKEQLRQLRARAEEYTQRNDQPGYESFWADDALVGLYLEPARVENFRLVAQMCADLPGDVIDMGCGCGTMLVELLAADRTGRKTVTGIDYAASAVRRCRALLPQGRFIEGSVHKTGLPDASFDLILSIQTMEHLDRPREAFDEMVRLLRPGGTILVTVPNGETDSWAGHANFWTEESLQAMAGVSAASTQRFNGDRNLLLIFKPKPAGLKVAGGGQTKDLTIVDQQSDFGTAIRELFEETRPLKLIETGTYKGTGTTSIIAQALRDLRLDDAAFFSIEVNPKHHSRALQHIEQQQYNVRLLNGLSLPRNLLPSREEIDAQYVRAAVPGAQFVDHTPESRVELYYRETDYSFLPDDLLGQTLAEFGGRPDFVLLDSGGHVGFAEFQYAIGKIKGDCWIALDDIFHVKHARSYALMQNDPRFTIRTVSREKFGFCIAHFSPNAKSAHKPQRRESAA